jgi:SsrA-binding protein
MASPNKDRKDRNGTKLIASNRTARRDFDILDTLEVGIMLKGSEVKSLRESKVQLNDAFARIDGGELWLYGMHLAAYSHAVGVFGHQPDRKRKLLAHRGEILRWKARLDQERLTIVALSLYFKEGRAKLELGLGKGRRKGDQRQALIKKEADIEARRAMAAGRRGAD